MSTTFSVDCTGPGNLVSGMVTTEGLNRFKGSTWYDRSPRMMDARMGEAALGESGFGDAAARDMAERIRAYEANRKPSDIILHSYKKGDYEVTEVSGPGHQKLTFRFKQSDLKDFKALEAQVKKILDAMEHMMRLPAGAPMA